MALKKKTFFSNYNEQEEKMYDKERYENLIKELNFYEINVGRMDVDEYEDFDENETNLNYLAGLMGFLKLDPKNEDNFEELKKTLIERWKIFKEKKIFWKPKESKKY